MVLFFLETIYTFSQIYIDVNINLRYNNKCKGGDNKQESRKEG